MRAMTSVLPPAANGTTTVTGRDGHLSCAIAATTDRPSVMAAAASLARIRDGIFFLRFRMAAERRCPPFLCSSVAGRCAGRKAAAHPWLLTRCLPGAEMTPTDNEDFVMANKLRHIAISVK